MSDSSSNGGGISDLIASYIRTGVPALVGLIVGWVASLGITLPAEAKDGLSLLIAFVAALVWYVVVRALERRWPKLGVLLGYPKEPVYSTAAATVADPAVITSVPSIVPGVADVDRDKVLAAHAQLDDRQKIADEQAASARVTGS